MELIGDLLRKWGSTGTVVDVTPAAGRTRREDIEAWFRLCEQPGSYEAGLIGSRLESFVVIDSESEFGWMRRNLILTDPETGLTEDKADQAALMLLNKAEVPLHVLHPMIAEPTITRTTPW